jgi:hypothetical protein
MPETVYRQQWIAASYNGVPLQGMMDGSSITIRPRGGEVDLTEGTDGGDVNLATDQGIEIEITLRETATTHEMLYAQHLSQGRGGPGATMSLYSGTGRTLTAPNCFVGMPGELSTGDKKQGSHTYRFVANRYNFY